MGLHIVPVFFRFGKTEDQLPAQGGFSRSHVAHDHVQTPAQTDGQFQLLQAGEMLGGRKEKLRLRRVGERLPV